MKAAWVGANILLRLLTNEPPELAKRAEALMRRAERREVVLVLPVLVIAEVIWVLGSHYGFDRVRIAAALQALVTSDGVAAEAVDDVLDAMSLMAEHDVDFVDGYLAAVAGRRAEPVATFDADFRRLGVELLPL